VSVQRSFAKILCVWVAALVGACTGVPQDVDAGEPSDAGVDDAGTPLVLGDVIDVSAGAEHTCAVRTDGSVWCWGRNDSGQLGDGTTTDRGKPVRVPGLAAATTVSAGSAHSCAVLVDGRVACWGSNSHAQLGSLDTTSTIVIANISDVVRVVAAYRHSIALGRDGLVRWWGDGRVGQIPIGGSSATAVPTVVVGITNATALHGRCVVHRFGRLSCWTSEGTWNEIAGITTAVDVAYPYAVLEDGSVVAFASGSERQANILTGGSARAVRVNSNEVCVQRPDDTLHCFVNDELFFRVFDLLESVFDVETWEVESGQGIRVFSLGDAHACALRSTGELVCWGSNSRGQLGQGMPSVANGAVDVEGIVDATAVAVGNQHACAIHDGGRVACWGFNYYASLGDGTRRPSSVPVDVIGIDDARSIAAGVGQVCAVRANGSLSCWGGFSIASGVARAHWPPSGIPSEIAGPSDVVHVSSSRLATCVQEAAGTVSCLGTLNLSSEMRIESSELAPVDAFFGTRQISVVDGTALCALRDDVDQTRVQCMGLEPSLNENAWMTPDNTPFDVGIDGVIALDAGNGHICALSEDKHVRCWGHNTSGEVAPLASTSQTSPLLVPGVDGVTQISAGMRHTCVRREDGRVLCWGAGFWAGQAGQFNFEAGVHVVENLDDAVAVSSGVMLACALRANGRIACWGNDQFGGLGTSSGSSFRKPLIVTFPDE